MAACFCGDDRCDASRGYKESDCVDYYDEQTERTPAAVAGQLSLLDNLADAMAEARETIRIREAKG